MIDWAPGSNAIIRAPSDLRGDSPLGGNGGDAGGRVEPPLDLIILLLVEDIAAILGGEQRTIRHSNSSLTHEVGRLERIPHMRILELLQSARESAGSSSFSGLVTREDILGALRLQGFFGGGGFGGGGAGRSWNHSHGIRSDWSHSHN